MKGESYCMDAELFSEGSIYYYENTSHTKTDYHNPSINQDFIVSRPVYILNSNPIPFDPFTINVLIITSSSNRVGIPINIDGYKDGKILPYAVYSVHKEYLTTYMGRVSDEMISSVNKAVKYHMGYSNEVPQYIVDYESNTREREYIVNKMSLKEKTVYDFLEEKCSFNSNYYTELNELFRCYHKTYKSNGYTRTQDFSRILNKQLNLYPNVELRVENHIKRYYGFSLTGNTHKVIIDDQKKATTTRTAESGILTLPNPDLYELLSDNSKKIYDKLDIIEKISNYYSSSENMSIKGIELQEKSIIKKMIVNDVDKKKNKVLTAMKNGANPLNMNDIDQYIVYICTDNEILNHLSEKHRKPGGVNRIKRLIRPNIKHFFPKDSW